MSPQPRRGPPAKTTPQEVFAPVGDPGGPGAAPRALLWAERYGLLDLALAGVLWAQWRVMPLPPGSPRWLLRHPVTESIWGVAVLPLATWLILAAGALAPLMRQRARAPGELPPGAGLWLGAYALMAACWFAILLNTYPVRFWGVAHLARFDFREPELLMILIPAALAPCWRRLARAMKLRILNYRKQRTRRGFSNNFTFQISYFKYLGAAGLLAVWAWAMTDNAIMSDGFGIIQFASTRHALAPNQYREPGTLLALRGAAMAARPLGLNAAQAIHAANFLAMLGVLALLGWAMRLMDLNRAQRRTGWWLIFSSLGITQMLLGRVELYPLVELAATATVVFGMAALAGRISPAWMALAFSLGLAGHLSLIFLLPAVVLALGFWTRREGHGWPAALAHLLGWGALVHLPLWGWLMLKLPNPTPAGLVAAVTGSLNTGARGIVETELGQYTWASKLARLVQFDTIINPLQLFFYLAGGALLVTALLLLAKIGKSLKGPKEKGLKGPRGLSDRQTMVIGAAFAGYFVYAYAWPNDWPWAEDWDLFSGITPLALLLVLRWLLPQRGSWGLPQALVRRVCWFALLLALTQNFYFHRYATFLSCFGKVTPSPEDGLAIQRYQLERGWVRGHDYVVQNGKVVEQLVPE